MTKGPVYRARCFANYNTKLARTIPLHRCLFLARACLAWAGELGIIHGRTINVRGRTINVCGRTNGRSRRRPWTVGQTVGCNVGGRAINVGGRAINVGGRAINVRLDLDAVKVLENW